MTGAEAEAIMARHARSFAPAARILARADRSRVAQLYALCRFVDDLADEDGSDAAAARLEAIEPRLASRRLGGSRRGSDRGQWRARCLRGGPAAWMLSPCWWMAFVVISARSGIAD